jgi:hypothetical protein
MGEGTDAVRRLIELRDAYVREINAAVAEGHAEAVAELAGRFAERAHQIAAA